MCNIIDEPKKPEAKPNEPAAVEAKAEQPKPEEKKDEAPNAEQPKVNVVWRKTKWIEYVCVLGRRRAIPCQRPQLNFIGRSAKPEYLARVDLQHSTGILEMTDTEFLNYGFEVWLTTSRGLPCSCSVFSKINRFIRNMGWYRCVNHISCVYALSIVIFLFTLLTINLWNFLWLTFFIYFLFTESYFFTFWVCLSFYFFYFLPLLVSLWPSLRLKHTCQLVSTNGKALTPLLSLLIILTLLPQLLSLCSPNNNELNQSEPSVEQLWVALQCPLL